MLVERCPCCSYSISKFCIRSTHCRWKQQFSKISLRFIVAEYLHKSIANFPDEKDLIHGPVFRRPRLLAKVFGANGHFLSLMIPRAKKERAAKVHQVKTVENALALRIEFNDAEKTSDTLIWAYEHEMLEAALLRRRPANACCCSHRLSSATNVDRDQQARDGDRTTTQE